MKKYLVPFSALVLGTLLVTSVTSYADVKSETTGKVKFVIDESTDPEIINPVDPEDTDEIDSGTSDGGAGQGGNRSFNINWVSNFNFGEINISSREMTQYALPTSLNFKNQKTPLSNLPNFIQVTDNRGKNTGWHVTASATPFKNTEGHELTGAKLLLTDPHVFGTGNNWNTDLEPSPHGTAVDLLQNPEAGNDIIKASAGKGQGTWQMAWAPKEENGEFQFAFAENQGVQLVVPANATPRADSDYSSTITWVLHDTPKD